MANVAWLVNAVTGAPEYSGRMVRQAMSVALGGATAARPLGARSGVRPGTPASTVALPTATSYVIHPHAGVLDTQASAFAGPYWYVVGSDGVDETGTVNAAHATWPRKDILWVRIDDPAEDGTAVPIPVTGYTAGVAAASNPAVPATPARAMRLATISVPLSGGGAPTIVWDAPDLMAGDVWSRLDTTNAFGPVRRQWGIARLTAPGGTPRATPLAVTFPVAFSGVPHVTAAIMGFRTSGAYNPVGLTTATADLWLATATGRSTTAMTLNLYESSSGTITAGYDLYVSWEAVGPA